MDELHWCYSQAVDSSPMVRPLIWGVRATSGGSILTLDVCRTVAPSRGADPWHARHTKPES